MPRLPSRIRPALFTGCLCVFTVSMSTAADADDGFRIMSEQEADAHRQVMASMDASAREAYRNAQYAQLRQRAAANGYSMPAAPPWSEHGAGDNQQEEIIARHEAMRARLDAHRAARQAQAEAPADTDAVDTTDVTNTREPVAPARADSTSPLAADPAGAVSPPAATSSAQQANAPVDNASRAGAGRTEKPAPTKNETAGDSVGDAPPAANTVAAARPAPPVMPTPPLTPVSPGQNSDRAAADNTDASAATMATYREQMRARFDDYLKERQAQQDETIRLQREQRENQMQNRTWFQSGPRIPPYPYPSARSYPPRYPSAPPAYRSPYWQPQR